MRTIFAALCCALVTASPALAGEARVELQTGAGWYDGDAAKGLIGAAGGYDWSLPGGAFFGVEESVDKVMATGYYVRWATSGRIGAHITPQDKLYATAGYNYGTGPHATDLGGGWEHSLGAAYTKVEYRRYFTENGGRDGNGALVGVGIHF
ncbi:MAG: hypothetical protein KGK11_02945 [Sphingomonadales bacterium]|nr:hypothetical protein [Sphingomonadales bacterium]